jgi:guanine deaminase
VVIPGLVNAHTHGNQAIERGLCDALPLDEWMVIASYGGAGARLTPRDLYVSTMVGAIQMLRSGTTAVVDCARADEEWLDEGLDAVTQAYVDIGMRAGIAALYVDLDYFSSLPLELVGRGSARPKRPRSDPDEILEAVTRYIMRWRGRNARITPMLGPASLPRCSTELLVASVDLARREGLRLQTHLLSGKSQIYVAQARHGRKTVEFLRDIGCLGPWASFAHSIWMDDEEIGYLAESGAVVVHNPVSNLKLGAGQAPVPELRRAGAVVALGTDGASSNDSQNMWETVKLAVLVHRTDDAPEQWLGASDALDMCWLGGALAVGQPIGRIAPGHRADITLLRMSEVFPAPRAQLANQLVYGDPAWAVDSVMVGGKLVVRDGQIVTVDVEAIVAEARELAQRIWAELPERTRHHDRARGRLQKLETAVRRQPWSRTPQKSPQKSNA